jgi:hypothetical protein
MRGVVNIVIGVVFIVGGLTGKLVREAPKADTPSLVWARCW